MSQDRFNLRQIVEDPKALQRFYRFMQPAGLVVGGRVTPRWMLDGASFWFADREPNDTVILWVDGKTGRLAPLFDVTRTRGALTELLGREPPYKGLPFSSMVELGDDRYQFAFEGTDYILSTKAYTIEALDAGSAPSRSTRAISRLLGVDPASRMAPRPYRRPMWLMEPMLAVEARSPDGRWFASVKGGNIMLRSPADDRVVPLTVDGMPDFAWDIEAPRLELLAGMEVRGHSLDAWSPESTRLFALKVDRRAVPDLPFIRYLKREEELCSIKVQRAGGPMDIAHPHVIDVLAKRCRPLGLGDTEDQFFLLIGWLPDGSEVLFARYSRDFKTVDVLAAHALDGSIRTILSDSAPTFVAIQHDVIYGGNAHATLLPDGSGLIWRSARSGWNHLYLYTLAGALGRPLTQGEFPVIEVVAIDGESGWVYFTAHIDQRRPYDTHLCRVKLTGGDIERLTPLDGQNVIAFAPLKKTFTALNSRPDRPFRTDFHACDGKHLANVQCADVTALEALGHVVSDEFEVTAADGETRLWGVMHKPADFDPRKSYPVIDHLYAGPQVSMVARHFGLGEECHRQLDRALAQLGYIVISVDARGTPERSKAFQDVVYRNWGRHEIPDHVAALQQLGRRHPFIDLDRVGVWGHSWGGYFTIRALTQAPQTFHVGVASAAGADPYDMFIYEPYLDLPARSKSAYDYATLYPYASRIQGKLMLVAGTSDPLNHSSALKMVHSLIEAGVDHELVVLPEGYHGFLGGKQEEYFVSRLVGHFERHLKPRKASARP